MKYCPFCGAVLLVDSAASFCIECGNMVKGPHTTDEIKSEAARPTVPRNSPSRSGNDPEGRILNLIKNSKPPSKKAKRKKSMKKRPYIAERPTMPNPYDEGYDGYYDDIMPADNGHTRDKLDPELIKRAAVIAAGAVILIIFSVILMYVL